MSAGRADRFQNRADTVRPGGETVGLGGETVGLGGETVELGGVPSLGRLYARGVAGSLRAAASRAGAVRPGDLPTTQLLARGVRVDRDHLTAYQHVVHEPGRDQLPAGFVHVLAFPVATALMVRDDFPLPLLGMVHVANRVEHRRAVTPDEALDIRVLARDLRAHRAGVTVDVVAEASVDGDTVWTGVSTYLAKGRRLVVDDEGRTGPTGQDRARSAPGFTPPLPTGQWRLAADTGRRYAAVSGDRNPIHLSALAARGFGFPRAIAHGMYTAARGLADVGPARGDAYRWEVEFAKPVLLPSTVTVRVAPQEGHHLLTADHDDRSTGGGSPESRAPEGHGRFSFTAWDQRRGALHLRGSVSPLR